MMSTQAPCKWMLAILLTCTVLLVLPISWLHANPIYKWTESDGSITFSPQKPPAGTAYTLVDAAKRAKQKTSGSTRQNKRGTTYKAPSSSRQSVTSQQTRPEPPLGGATRSSGNMSGRTTTGQASGQPLNNQPNSAAVSALSVRHARCKDLRKRVVSLERRLKSRLTPEDMDNTVVHMARYQLSYDQHCVQ